MTSPNKPLAALALLFFVPLGLSLPVQAQTRDLDIVLAGGRVIDPETGLDAIRDVGIRDGTIIAISNAALASRLKPGGTLLRASGLVVAPGFIDLHAHGQSNAANEYQAHDGVTTALELEWGYSRVGTWLAARRGKALINFGCSVSHGAVRAMAMPGGADRRTALEAVAGEDDPLRASQAVIASTFYEALPDDATSSMLEFLDEGLAQGALGIGMAHQYYPGTTREEVLGVFRLAAERQAPIFTHVRSMGLEAIQEVLANAAATGAPLHIVHINSSAMSHLPTALSMVEGAQRRGLDITTESYPYTAGSTFLQSSIFDEGWQERLGIDYGDLQWQDTGERLTAESFTRYRRQGGTIILHMMKEEMIRLAMATPFVIVASDGMPYAPGAHPRSAGTFARVLGRYVREQGALSLPQAIERMTLMPARRLELIAPAMRKKARVQIGADADLTVFDPQRVKDLATFETGPKFSQGIEHVLVGGVPVVLAGKTVEGVFPGQAVVGRYSAMPGSDAPSLGDSSLGSASPPVNHGGAPPR